MQIATMHAYIDQESFAGMTIDAALRELLKGFRLPGKPCCVSCLDHVSRAGMLQQSFGWSLWRLSGCPGSAGVSCKRSSSHFVRPAAVM